jgi:translin
MSKPVEDLEIIAAEFRPYFVAEDEAREKALRICRQVIRGSADAIRAVHRQEHDKAKQLLDSVYELLRELNRDLAEHGRLLHSGFIHDAQ